MKISLKEDINSISYVKANFTEVLNNIKKKHRPMIITQNGQSSGVLIDINSWEFILKKISLFKLVNEGEESLKTDKVISLNKLKSNFKKKYDL